MNTDPLERLDARIVMFRLGHAVYAAVYRHLQKLYQADVSETGPNFVKIIQRISKTCLEGLELGDPVEPPEMYLSSIQHSLRVVLDRLERTRSEMLPIVEKIHETLRIPSPAECRSALHSMANEGWQWFAEFISTKGGQHAQERLQTIEGSGPATLEIDLGDKDFTYCEYREKQHEILLHAGKRNRLELFFDLPFYFLHEYASHAYPLWDDKHSYFSEAYLLRAAHSFLAEKLRTNRPRRSFLGLNFDAERALCDPNGESDLQKAEDCYAHLYDTVGDRFVIHLLEWATQPGAPAETRARDLVFAGFHALAKDPETVEGVFGKSYQGFERVHQRLTATVDNILRSRKQNT